MPRPIPDRAMPHRVTIRPCTGMGDRGPVYGDPIEHVRANLNGGRGQGKEIVVGDGGWTVTKTGEVTLDARDLPLFSEVVNEATGNSTIVGAVVDWDQPPVQRFLVASLGLLVRPSDS
jgi:hypothetical protein